MSLRRWFDEAKPLPGAPGTVGITVQRSTWRQVAADLAAGGGRLVTLWTNASAAGEPRLRAAFLAEPGLLIVTLPLASDQDFPGLEDLFPAASRLQRALTDLTGVRSTDPDTRPWLRHAGWPAGFHPLTDAGTPPRDAEPVADAYPFVRVAGDGVHEIPVGPVHAGIIEPGHFRFSIVGEKVLRLEQRLGYVHKGIERRFTEMPLLDGHRLAARISGDSAVAYSWAYCQALEGMAGVAPPPRATWLRALGLELERIANHLGDLGALGNDAGFAFGLAQFSRLKEQLLRATGQALGQRYLLDLVVPGGTSADVDDSGLAALGGRAAELMRETTLLREIYDEHAGVRDRFVDAGTVPVELAARLGLTGLAGRASGQPFDLRADLPCEPYGELAPRKCGSTGGDVAARVELRFCELLESCRLVQAIATQLPEGPHQSTVPVPYSATQGIGLIEGWRGPVLVALEAGPANSIRRCHAHDPSWQNWPALEHAIIGNIVPDFPLINKSFNLSYSGHDL